MKHTEEFQTKLFDEMVARIKKTDESVPAKSNEYYYYSRTEGDAEYPLYCRKEGELNANEQIMLNVPEMAKGFSYYNIGSYSVSENNKVLAYSEDTLSRRKYTIKFKSLIGDKVYTDEIANTTGGITWTSDNKTVFYTVKHPETLLPYKVYKHVLGTSSKNDELVYEEKDNTFYTFYYKTKSRKYIMIGVSSSVFSEYRYIGASKPDSEFKLVQPRERDLEYGIAHYKDHFYIRTNYQAKNFRMMKTPVNKTTKENWVEIIPNREDVLRYGYTSLTTPSSTIDYNMETKEKTIDNPLLLKTNMDFGHGGVSGRFKRLKEVALEYAFVFDQIGINE